MTATSPSSVAGFGDPAAIRSERAAGELRAGRPILLDDGQGQLRAVLAMDSASERGYAAFAAASQNQHYLYLTATRAEVLGLQAPEGARIALANIGFAELAALAYQRGTATPTQWQPGDALDLAAVEVSRLGLLLPALIAAQVDETTASTAFGGCQRLPLADLLSSQNDTASLDYELVVRTPVPLRDAGDSEFVVFRGGVAQRDQVAIVVGKPDFSKPMPVRVHSSCLTGDLFGSLKCDCGDQLHHGLATLRQLGGGVLLYLDQEGRGTGIAAKMRAYGYQHAGLDTIDADAQLGFGPDGRRYASAVAMLRALGIQQVRLLTNNPSKVERLRKAGIDVIDRVAVTGEITAENEQYLRTKAARAGHLLDVDALIQAAAR